MKLNFIVKSTLIMVILVSRVSSTYCQNISFEELLALRTQSLETLETRLSSIGWVITNTEKSTEINEDDKITFAYNLDQYDGEKAQSWITFYKSNVGNSFNYITIQFQNSKTYNIYMKSILKNGFKFFTSKITDDNGFEKYYKKDQVYCTVTSESSTKGLTKGALFLFSIIRLKENELTLKNVKNKNFKINDRNSESFNINQKYDIVYDALEVGEIVRFNYENGESQLAADGIYEIVSNNKIQIEVLNGVIINILKKNPVKSKVFSKKK